MIRSGLRHGLVLLLVVCIPFSHTLQLLASTSESDQFVPHTTDAFDDAIDALVVSAGPANIVAYDPDLGETANGTEIAVQKLEAEHPGTHVVVIPAREKQHATIHEFTVSDPNLPGEDVDVKEVVPGATGILEADIGANIERLLEAAPSLSTFKKAAGGVAAMADASLLTGNVDQLLAMGVSGLSDDPDEIEELAAKIANNLNSAMVEAGQRGISIEFVLDGPVATHEDIRADVTEETWLAIRDLILDLIPDPTMSERILMEAAKFVTSPGGLAHQIGAAITRQLEIGLITLVAVGTVLVIVGSGGTLAPAAIPSAMVAVKAYFAASIALNVHDVITSFEYRAVPIGLASQLELSAARDNLAAFLIAHSENRVTYANSEYPNRASSAVLTTLLNVLAASGEYAGQLQWLDMIPFLIRPPRAADFEITVESGGIVDLPMWCLSSGIDSGLSFSIETLTYSGIGTISGTPPNCTLAVHATTCADSVQIPYTITNLLDETSQGVITVNILRDWLIEPVTIYLHPGETRRIAIWLTSCPDDFTKISIGSSSEAGIRVDCSENPILNSDTGGMYQTVVVTGFQDASIGTHILPMEFYRFVHSETLKKSSILTVIVTNAPPNFNPNTRQSEFDAWIPAGDGRREVYIMDPDWEQAFCFTAIDPDGDVLDFYVNRSPRYGQAGVLASGSAGRYEVHATYLPSHDALAAAHDSNRPLQDSFTIITRDAYGGRDEARVNVRINVLNRVPDATDDDASTDQDVEVSIAVLANDEDLDGDTLSIASVSQPSHGSVSISGTQIRYTPTAGFAGNDGFSYTVSDGHGGSASASVGIDVIQTDFTPPTFTTYPPDIDVPMDSGCCNASPSIGSATATDNNCIPTVSAVRSDGQSLGSAYEVGTTTIEWTARDSVGNTATYTQTVVVQTDAELPVISSCPGDITVDALPGNCSHTVNWSEPTAQDNCDGTLLFASRSHVPGSSFNVGTTPITYVFEDSVGNLATCGFAVTVVETDPPSIVCPADISTEAAPLASGAVVQYSTPIASDDCDNSVSVGCSPASGSFFAIGDTAVTCIAEDDSGNTDTCTFLVSVTEPLNHPPVARNDSATMSTGQGTISISVLSNDYDVDGDDLSIISAHTGCGVAGVDSNRVVYGTMNCDAPAGSKVTVFYTISDGRGGTASATISVRLPSSPRPMSNP